MIEEFKDKYRAIGEQKRAELMASMERGEVADPIITPIILFSALHPILFGVITSVAISAASFGLSRAFAPKPPRQTIGKLSGTVQIQNSEQGIFIPEIYGASPTVSLVTGASPTWQNVANCSTGAGGALTKNAGGTAWNAGASHNVAVTSGQDAFFKFTVGTGYAAAGFFTTASPVSGNINCDFCVQWNPDGSVSIKYSSTLVVANVTHWVTGDRFHVELRDGHYHVYKGSAEIRPDGFVPPTPTYPLYMGVGIQNVGAGISESKVKIDAIGLAPNAGRGGIKIPAIIVWTSGIRKVVSVTAVSGGKGGGGHQTVENISYNIDIACLWCRGRVALLREYANADVMIDQTPTSLLLSGAYNAATGADTTYDPVLPPNPQTNYSNPIYRTDADVVVDGDFVGSGLVQGGGSLFTIYEGNATQHPDPTIEADVDARFGTGSTPAYRDHALIVHKTLQMARWGGIVPNFTAVWEHKTLKTLDTIFGALCERVNVKAANSDYNFAGLSGIASRGMLIAGRPFAPSEVIGSPEIELAYSYFVTEAEGQLIGYVDGAEPSVTIPDTEVGWLDGETEPPDILPEVDTILAAEIDLPREVTVKFIDLDFDWDPSTQSAKRQITEGVAIDLLEVQLALLADEARATAQRKLYRDYVGGSAHKFTLPWTYLYLYPGYKIIINRAEGFTHTLRLTSISGGIGLLDCEGIAIEPEVFTQPAVGAFGFPWDPNQQVPAMTVALFLDTPLLRDGDETNNNGVGWYAAGTPRTGVNQNWLGWALYVNRNNNWSLIGSANLPATIGTVISVTGLNTADPSIFDRTGVIVVDLYGTTAILASVTEQDLLSDATVNLAVFGDMVGQFATATQVAGYPNRWSLTTLLNGRRGTEDQMAIAVGARFCLVNAALVFVPAQITDLDGTFSYRAVTTGQSLDDAATVSFTWTAKGLKPLAPVNLRGTRDTLGSLLIEWTRRSRLGSGLTPRSDVPLAEEFEQYDVEIYSGGNLKRTMRSIPGGAQAAVLLPAVGSTPGYISGNTLLPTPSGAYNSAYTQQRLGGSGNWIEATLAPGAAGSVFMGITESAYAPRFDSDNESADLFQASVTFARYANSLSVVERFGKAGAPDTTTVFSNSSFAGVTHLRIRILISGTEVRYYWDYTGPSSVPFYVSSRAPRLPCMGIFTEANDNVSQAKNVTFGTSAEGPSIIYSAAQQVLDFGSLQNPISVRVYQISSVVGRGAYVAGNL